MLYPEAWAPAHLPRPECCTLTTSAFTAIDQSARVAVERQERSGSRRLAVSQPGWDLRPGHSELPSKLPLQHMLTPGGSTEYQMCLKVMLAGRKGSPALVCTGCAPALVSDAPEEVGDSSPGTGAAPAASSQRACWTLPGTKPAPLGCQCCRPPPGSCVSTCTHGGLQPGGQCGHQTRRRALPESMACTQRGICLAQPCTCEGSQSSTGALRCMRSMMHEANT